MFIANGEEMGWPSIERGVVALFARPRANLESHRDLCCARQGAERDLMAVATEEPLVHAVGTVGICFPGGSQPSAPELAYRF